MNRHSGRRGPAEVNKNTHTGNTHTTNKVYSNSYLTLKLKQETINQSINIQTSGPTVKEQNLNYNPTKQENTV